MPIMLKFGPVRGESSVTGYEGWCEINSFSLEAARPTVFRHGPEAGKTKPQFVPAVITRTSDSATPAFMRAALRHVRDTATIAFLRTGGDAPVCYLEIELSGCWLRSYNLQGGGDAPLEEAMALNYDAIQYKGFAVGNSIAAGPQAVAIYDLLRGS